MSRDATTRTSPSDEDACLEAVTRAARAAVAAVAAFEFAQRRLHPPDLPALRAGMARIGEEVTDAIAALREAPRPTALMPAIERLEGALAHATRAIGLFVTSDASPAPPAQLLASLRELCRAQEQLYPLRRALPPIARLFAERAAVERLARFDASAATPGASGFHRAGPDGPDARGGFVLHVPESFDGQTPMPLAVALHGAFGFGQDFVWTWLREARSRGCALLAPTSSATTWSLDAPGRDTARLASMVTFVRERWPIDSNRILLTGLSDGGTFALLAGLAENAPYTHIASVAGVLHPANFAIGNVGRARGRAIRLIHGALDWMFPVALARAAHDALRDAGAEVVYREIADCSHTWPREENAHILRWMSPALAMPEETT